MSRRFTGTQSFRTASRILTPPLSIACWMMIPTGVTSSWGVPFCLQDIGASTELVGWEVNGQQISRSRYEVTADWVVDVDSTAVTYDRWQFMAMIVPSASLCIGVFGENWAGRSVNTTTVNFDALNAATISQFAAWEGNVAHCMAWDVALSQREAWALARGSHPRRIARHSLRHYIPMRGGLAAERDEVTGLVLDQTGTPARGPYEPPVFGMARDPLETLSGNVVLLFDALNEASASDADAIRTLTPGSYYECALSSVSDPGVHTGHIVRVRAKGSGATFKIGLYQSSTLIEEWTQELGAGFATFSRTLAEANVANITDYGALRLRFTAI